MAQKSLLRWENNFFTFFCVCVCVCLLALRINDFPLGRQTYLELDSDAGKIAGD